MLLPSEIEAKSLIPAIRSILAQKLIKEYRLKEEDVAKVLGVTQAAVSNCQFSLSRYPDRTIGLTSQA